MIGLLIIAVFQLSCAGHVASLVRRAAAAGRGATVAWEAVLGLLICVNLISLQSDFNGISKKDLTNWMSKENILDFQLLFVFILS